MHFILIGIFLLLLIFGPQLWARYTFARYSKPIQHFPGTGGELALHLIDKFDLKNVNVEITEQGDHYDPESKTVRLTQANYQNKSLTAIAIAAHEVGHAIQHSQNHPMLELRSKLVKTTIIAEQISTLAFIGIPIVTAITRAPGAGLLMFVIAISSMLLSTIVHLVTLPVEWDASFNKALPILKKGNYINQNELVATNKILKAAALTYVAGSLASLLNLARWIAILRRR